jgi:hypothetical protein
MSLRAFHLFFIGLSVILAAFVGAWAAGEYRMLHQPSYLVACAASLVSAAGLMVYGAAFQRKTRNLS